MKILIATVALLAATFFMAKSKKPACQFIGQGILVCMLLAIGAAILFCIFMPIIKPETQSGVLILFTIPLLIVGLIPWLLLGTSRETVRDRRRTPEEREKFLTETVDKIETDLEKKILEEREVAGKFWTSASKRRELRENISHNQFMLRNLRKIKKQMDKKKRDR